MEQSEFSLFVTAVIIGGMISFVYLKDVWNGKFTREEDGER